MLERLNFYDFYGHLVPGISFWLGLALPVLLTRRLHVGDASITSFAALAVILLVVAYQTGLALQLIVGRVLPSKTTRSLRGGKSGYVYPSDAYLDPQDTKFSEGFRTRVSRQLEETFGVALELGPGVERARDDAFRQARGLLVVKGVARYVEQFEGMYSLMRGLFVTSVVAAAFVLGGTFAVIQETVLGPRRVASADVCIALLFAWVLGLGFAWLAWRVRQGGLLLRFFILVAIAAFVGVLMFCATGFLGVRPHLPLWALTSLGIFDIGLAILYEWGHRHYTDYFARTVYENFSIAVLPSTASAAATPAFE